MSSSGMESSGDAGQSAQKSSAFAIASLVLGILGILGIIGCTCGSAILGILAIVCEILAVECAIFGIIPAIVCGVLAMRKIKDGTGAGKGMAIAGIATGILASVLLVLIPAVSIVSEIGSKESARRVSCASNMIQIALSIRMYSQENGEQFPDKNGAEGLEMLRSAGYLENTKMYICPNTGTVPAKEGEMLTESNVDYVYVGGYNESTDADTALLWEKDSRLCGHDNILFVDGHIQHYEDHEGDRWKEKKSGK